MRGKYRFSTPRGAPRPGLAGRVPAAAEVTARIAGGSGGGGCPTRFASTTKRVILGSSAGRIRAPPARKLVVVPVLCVAPIRIVRFKTSNWSAAVQGPARESRAVRARGAFRPALYFWGSRARSARAVPLRSSAVAAEPCLLQICSMRRRHSHPRGPSAVNDNSPSA